MTLEVYTSIRSNTCTSVSNYPKRKTWRDKFISHWSACFWDKSHIPLTQCHRSQPHFTFVKCYRSFQLTFSYKLFDKLLTRQVIFTSTSALVEQDNSGQTNLLSQPAIWDINVICITLPYRQIENKNSVINYIAFNKMIMFLEVKIMNYIIIVISA